MWSKLLTLVLTALFFVAVCDPVAAHDGRIRPFMDPSHDEQPWGGEHYYDPTDFPLDVSPDPGKFPGKLYFIKLTVNIGWSSLRHIVVGALEPDVDSGKTGQAVTIDQTPGETVNYEQGSGTR